MARFEFEPGPNIRTLDVKALLRKSVELRFQHTDGDLKIQDAKYKHEEAVKKAAVRHDKKLPPFVPPAVEHTSQYVQASFVDPWEPQRSFKGRKFRLRQTLADWIHIKPTFPKDHVLKAKIVDAWLVEHMNGGRSDPRHYRTYSEFFDEKRKARCNASLLGGLLYRMTQAGGGDPDRVDLGIRVKLGSDAPEGLRGIMWDFEGCMWEVKAPEEWYSELFMDRMIFRCVDGFYATPEAAIEAFAQKKSDDMFGERYFPVISIDIEHPESARIREIAGHAKACSQPIVAHGRVFIGLRCKPYEYTDCINEIYKLGGAVPIGATWDWQG